MTRLSVCATVLILTGSTAYAQIAPNEISISSFNPADAVAPASTIEGAGVKVGEGTLLRPVLGVETGFVSNVFYEDTDTQAAGLLRLLLQVGVGSLGKDRLEPVANAETSTDLGSFQYRADLRLSYDLMLSNNETVTDTGGLGVGASVRGIVNPSGRFAFSFEDDFHRLIRAANFETDANTNRDINRLRLQLGYQPNDRAITGYLYYLNMLDIFEQEEQSFANRMSNTVGLHPMWRFLPQTQAYLDLSIGNVTALDSGAPKSDSFPLVLRAGIATLLSIKTTLNLDGGYTNGFYSNGPSFSAPTIGATVGYRYSELGRASLGYILAYEDSINANYYRDHVIRGTIQQLVKPVVFMIQPEIHFREYQGVTVAVPGETGADTRNDLILALIAGVHYNFRNWIAATVNYRFSSVQTDYVEMSAGGTTDDPSFTRHEILVGVRAAL